jgi:hypothetical protein
VAPWALVFSFIGSACEHVEKKPSHVLSAVDERRTEANSHAAHDALALVFDQKLLVQTGPRQWHVRAPSMTEKGMCPDAAFAGQPHTSGCTAVLISPVTLLTTSSCARRHPCSNMGIIFGFDRDGKESDPRTPGVSQLASCLRIDERPQGLSIIWLKSAVSGRTPAQLGNIDVTSNPGFVDVLSHPSGIPAKRIRTKFLPAVIRDGQPALIDAAPAEVSPGAAVFGEDSRTLIGIVNSSQESVISGEGCGQWNGCLSPPCRETVVTDFALDQ